VLLLLLLLLPPPLLLLTILTFAKGQLKFSNQNVSSVCDTVGVVDDDDDVVDDDGVDDVDDDVDDDDSVVPGTVPSGRPGFPT